VVSKEELDLLKMLGAIASSSAVTVALTKWLDHLIQVGKEKREMAREAAKPPKDKLGEATQAAGEITPIIYNLLGVYCPGGNVNICEFHNGDEFYSRRGIQRMTMTFEACIDRGQSRRLDMQNIILSNEQLNWIEEIRKDKQPVYYPHVSELPQGYIRDYYEYYEIKSAYVAGLYDTQNRLIGLLSLTSSGPDFMAGQRQTGISNQIQNLQNFLTPASK
jgi:hypothetical protein